MASISTPCWPPEGGIGDRNRPRVIAKGFAFGPDPMDVLRAFPPHVATPVVWALIPWIALGADTLARALPRAAYADASTLCPLYPSWRERAPFLTAVVALLALAWWRFGPGRAFLGAASGGITLLVIAAIDWRHHLIFERVLLIGTVDALAVAALDLPKSATLVEALDAGGLALAAGTGLFLTLRLLYLQALRSDRVPLGIGDVLLAGMIGTLLGREAARALALGIALAGIWTSVALRTGRIGRQDPIPLGSFLSWGAVIVLLCQ